ncbi:presenilin family intramembrane aspartyl protease PSH [Methanocalculus sp.]|uniref:presenilin family intramembrane aspartyl protease PSH n=1 Tax=Methanocalculus sp. TaxID=2004547 RepID=UPI0027242220|nr:presenilin family intramembrane aspartyl protease PSH [Methanocalculus sp.]MDO8840838.1 presenilin family intramembrane aspartyl protease PSH [Methanocalculus sp.]
MERRNLPAILGMPIILLAVIVGGVLLASPVTEAGLTAFEDPDSMANPFIFLAILLIFTALLLLLIRAAKQQLISLIIGGAIFLTYIYVFQAILYTFVGDGILLMIGPVALAGVSVIILYRYPRWYVVDALGIILASGVAAIFGASLAILPVVILLAILAIYDAISVYRTKHMITLAEGVMDQKMPILFIIPKERGYTGTYEKIRASEEDQESPKDDVKKERGTFLMGMGDAIMPAILVVSAYTFLSSPIPAIGAAIGSFVGLGVLLMMVFSGKPQAGLPPLNGGVILGFLAACSLVSEWSWVFVL